MWAQEIRSGKREVLPWNPLLKTGQCINPYFTATWWKKLSISKTYKLQMNRNFIAEDTPFHPFTAPIVHPQTLSYFPFYLFPPPAPYTPIPFLGSTWIYRLKDESAIVRYDRFNGVSRPYLCSCWWCTKESIILIHITVPTPNGFNHYAQLTPTLYKMAIINHKTFENIWKHYAPTC